MFERFGPSARQAAVLALDEARQLRHGYLGTEHLLLGILAEGDGVGAAALQACGATLAAAREQVLRLLGEGDQPVSGHLPFTSSAKQVLEFALVQAQAVGSDVIDSGHLLLGLLQLPGTAATMVLEGLTIPVERLRMEVIAREPGADPHGGMRPALSHQVRLALIAARERAAAAGGVVESEHLLLALVEHDTSVAARALAQLGVDAPALSRAVDDVLAEPARLNPSAQ